MREAALGWLRCGASASALLLATGASAQASVAAQPATSSAPPAPPAAANVTRGAAATQTFTPADFERYAPRSALDMVRQIPDFRITESSDARGLGQASQNVLINGQRIAGKDEDAQSVLGRIAARAVSRIEVVDGATLSIPGLTGRVANVVTIPSGLSGQFRLTTEARPSLGLATPGGNVSLSGRLGENDVSFSISNESSLRGGASVQRLRQPNGGVIYDRDEFARFDHQTPKIAGSLSRAWGDGSVLNLALSGQYFIERTRIDGSADFPAFEPPFDDVFTGTYDGWSIEASGDYAFSVGDGATLKLIALQRLSDGTGEDRFSYLYRLPTATTRGSAVQFGDFDGESVVRAELTTAADADAWTFAVEGAYNFLDRATSFGMISGSAPVNFKPLPGGTVFVDEWRAETSASRRFSLTPNLTLQATLAGEISRLRLAGRSTRQFLRPKGKLALAWTPSSRWTVNVALERRVGQLSFGDFAAQLNVQQGAQLGSNEELVPAQSWFGEVLATRTLGAAGSLTLGARYEAISDIVDYIPIGPRLAAVGNIASARRAALLARGTFNLDGLGIAGGRVTADLEFADSSVRDPLLGELRPISGDRIVQALIDFRHDVSGTPLAWGTSLFINNEAPSFRPDQVYLSRRTKPVISAFIEHKDVLGLTVRATLRNLLGSRDAISRDVFAPRRDVALDFTERQERRISPFVILSVSGSF